jgi:hypothetical protein
LPLRQLNGFNSARQLIGSNFGGRVELAVAAYNVGEGFVNSFMTGIPLVLHDGRIVNARRLMSSIDLSRLKTFLAGVRPASSKSSELCPDF